MSQIRGWFAARRPRKVVIVPIVAVLAAAAIVAATAGMSPGPTADLASATPSPSATPVVTDPRTPAPTTEPTLDPTPEPTSPTAAVVGADGRLTVLLLGSDYRRGHAGNRTDMIMVVSVDASSGAVAAASIPRDTVNFPLPDGSVYRAKVNGLYQSYLADDPAAAGTRMREVVAAALGVEIDGYLVLGFEGVVRLVDALGGVDVTLEKAVNDPYYWLTATKSGVFFPVGVNHLTGERALIFARTRKGDNDFERARRQQQLIAATAETVALRGIGILPDLLEIGATYIQTDLPLDAAPVIYRLVADAKIAGATRVVFGPRKWASSVGGSSFELKVADVRGWVTTYMPPVVAPEAAASGAPTPTL